MSSLLARRVNAFMMKGPQHNETAPRICGECSACCRGRLSAEIYGHKMGQGVPCHYLKPEGCGIYERRPEVCRSFMCGWLLPDSPFPEDWRPDKVGFIVRVDLWQGNRCWFLMSTGADPGDDVLQWMREYSTASGEPHIVKKQKSWLCFGKPEFQQAMIKRAQSIVGQVQFRTSFLSPP